MSFNSENAENLKFDEAPQEPTLEDVFTSQESLVAQMKKDLGVELGPVKDIFGQDGSTYVVRVYECASGGGYCAVATDNEYAKLVFWDKNRGNVVREAQEDFSNYFKPPKGFQP